VEPKEGDQTQESFVGIPGRVTLHMVQECLVERVQPPVLLELHQPRPLELHKTPIDRLIALVIGAFLGIRLLSACRVLTPGRSCHGLHLLPDELPRSEEGQEAQERLPLRAYQPQPRLQEPSELFFQVA
jgi:hypothetical protein